MPKENKDKVIYGLIIAIIVLLANTLIKDNPFKDEEKISLTSDEFYENNEDVEEGTIYEANDDEDIKVYISGEVNKPGVYTVTYDDRLIDLIDMAGGLTNLASDKNLNLAQRLEDQMKVYIPNINEKEKDEPELSLIDSSNISNNELININTASKDELTNLPNIGAKRAEAIIEYREANKFEKIEDIKNVTGIGDKMFEALKDLISV